MADQFSGRRRVEQEVKPDINKQAYFISWFMHLMFVNITHKLVDHNCYYQKNKRASLATF